MEDCVEGLSVMATQLSVDYEPVCLYNKMRIIGVCGWQKMTSVCPSWCLTNSVKALKVS